MRIDQQKHAAEPFQEVKSELSGTRVNCDRCSGLPQKVFYWALDL